MQVRAAQCLGSSWAGNLRVVFCRVAPASATASGSYDGAQDPSKMQEVSPNFVRVRHRQTLHVINAALSCAV